MSAQGLDDRESPRPGLTTKYHEPRQESNDVLSSPSPQRSTLRPTAGTADSPPSKPLTRHEHGLHREISPAALPRTRSSLVPLLSNKPASESLTRLIECSQNPHAQHSILRVDLLLLMARKCRESNQHYTILASTYTHVQPASSR